MKGAHFPPTFPHPRFLERKLGKELCAKLRFASGDAALRGGVLMISRLPRLCQTRRCHFNPASPKFLLFRPQRAEARRAQGLVLGRRKVAEISLDGVSRNGGPGGGLTMSASKGAALIGRTPLGASQGELPQRGKRGWPGPLVTFCASRK